MANVAAVILAGGRGTRLGLAIPKGMVPLGGRPFLEYLILERVEAGFEPVILCVDHLSHLIRAHFTTDPWTSLPLTFVETRLRGTGRDLLDCLPQIPTDSFLLANADTVVDAPLAGLRRRGEQVDDRGVLVLTRRPGVPNEGAFFVGDDGTILASLEQQEAASQTIDPPQVYSWRGSSTGMVILSRRLLSGSPKSEEPLSLEATLLPTLIARGEVAALDNGLRYVLDFGTPERLRRFRQEAPVIRKIYEPDVR